jgi:hypothetical protein
MHSKIKVVGALFFAAFSLAPMVGATEILTTTFNAWKSTTTGTGIAEWDFNIPNSTYNTSSGYNLNVGTYGPIIVTAPDAGGYSLSKNQGYGGSSITLAGPGDGSGSINFAAPGIGLTDFMLGLGITGNAAPIIITLSDGEVFTANPSVNGAILLGLSSATPITSFALTTASGSQVQLTDFLAGISNQPASTPDAPAAEVATALMIGSGLLLFGGLRKVFSNVSAAVA